MHCYVKLLNQQDAINELSARNHLVHIHITHSLT